MLVVPKLSRAQNSPSFSLQEFQTIKHKKLILLLLFPTHQNMSMMFISRAENEKKKKKVEKTKCNKKHTKTIKNSRIVLAFDFSFVYCGKWKCLEDLFARKYY
jgi:hypothetical protein